MVFIRFKLNSFHNENDMTSKKYTQEIILLQCVFYKSLYLHLLIDVQCKFKKYCCIICSLELIYVLVFMHLLFYKIFMKHSNIRWYKNWRSLLWKCGSIEVRTFLIKNILMSKICNFLNGNNNEALLVF